MNYTLKNIPERTQKPRQNGLTMVMDKGLSVRQIEDFLEVAGPWLYPKAGRSSINSVALLLSCSKA